MSKPTVPDAAQRESTSVTDQNALVCKVAPPFVLDTTEEMVRHGYLVSRAEFQKLMGWSSAQTVARALADHRVFALALDSEMFFPTFFGDAAFDRRHLAAVSKMLGDLPGGAKLQFFISRKGSLGGKIVLEALADGQLERVLCNAAAFAEL